MYKRQRKYVNATGLIQWMLNSAWPSNVWRLYDPMLNPSASYFAVKAACAEPLHVVYSYADASVWVVHNLGGAAANASRAGGFVTQVEVLLPNGTTVSNASFAMGASVPADGVARAGEAPAPAAMARLLGANATYLVRLSLWDGNSTAASRHPPRLQAKKFSSERLASCRTGSGMSCHCARDRKSASWWLARSRPAVEVTASLPPRRAGSATVQCVRERVAGTIDGRTSGDLGACNGMKTSRRAL